MRPVIIRLTLSNSTRHNENPPSVLVGGLLRLVGMSCIFIRPAWMMNHIAPLTTAVSSLRQVSNRRLQAATLLPVRRCCRAAFVASWRRFRFRRGSNGLVCHALHLADES